MISSSIINGTSISVPNLNQYVAQGDIFARVFGYNEEAPETNYFSSGLSSESTSSLSYSEPEYLQFKIISKSGFLFYNWEIEIINPNPYDVVVTYNTKMCFGDDAKNFTNLVDLETVTILANSSKIVTISANAFAGWITASIDYTYWSNDYRKITCADGLKGNLTMNTPTHNKIFRN